MATHDADPGRTARTEPDASTEGPGGTPEGHTAEAPAADEFGKLGTPAAGLSPAVPHAADAQDVHSSDPASPGAAHAHEDAHGEAHEEEGPGPIDWGAWAISALGVAAGGAVALALFAAIQRG